MNINKRSVLCGVAAAVASSVVPTITSGQTAMKIGVNLAGLEFGNVFPGTLGHDYFAPTTATMDYYLGKGIKLFRLPFRAERIQPVIGGALDSTYLGLLTTLLSHAGANNAAVILDMHNYGQYIASGGNYALGGMYSGKAVNNWTQDMFNNLWLAIDAAITDKTGLLGYGLMNEPYKIPADTWTTYAQVARDALAAVNSVQSFYIWPAQSALLPLADITNQVVYEFHFYCDWDNSGTRYDWATQVMLHKLGTDKGAARVRSAEERMVGTPFNGRRWIVGETGVPNNDDPADEANWLTALDNLLSTAKTYGTDHAEASIIWAGGGYWGTYPLSVDPVNGVDAPQMAIITKYV